MCLHSVLDTKDGINGSEVCQGNFGSNCFKLADTQHILQGDMYNNIKQKILRLRRKHEYKMRLIQQIRQDLKYKQQQCDIEQAEMVFNKTPRYKGQKI